MKTRISHSVLIRAGQPVRRHAFSLVEVLVVTVLLSVIIIGLMLMFGQTQRAYRLGTTQVDVLESGRMVTDLMSRDLAQIRAAGAAAVNFYLALSNTPPLLQDLPGNNGLARTNLLEEVLFLTRENQKWTAVGYYVRTNDVYGNLGFPGAGAGSLYRFEMTYNDQLLRNNPNWPWLDFQASKFVTNGASRLVEGVTHFKLRTFDPEGFWIDTAWMNRNTNAQIYYSPAVPIGFYPFGETPFLYFISNAVPAAVEVELGILEAREIERARSITSPTARADFLKQQAGKTHLFRWRVPVRNFDSAVYQ